MNRITRLIVRLPFAIVVFAFGAAVSPAQAPAVSTNSPAKIPAKKIIRIDDTGFKDLIAPQEQGAKPLLINFWATWCDPCREEFPDLVKIDEEFRDRIDFITVSLDDLEEIDRGVPQFLQQMNAKMPAYLLFTNRENEVIGSIDKDWNGGLPFSVLFNEKRQAVYTKQGKIKLDVIRSQIGELLASNIQPMQIAQLPFADAASLEESYQKGIDDAKRDIANGRYIIRSYGFSPGFSAESREKVKRDYGVEYVDHGCLVSGSDIEYIKGYNEISRAEVRRKFGSDF